MGDDGVGWIIVLLAVIVVGLVGILALSGWHEHIESIACIERGMQWVRGACLR